MAFTKQTLTLVLAFLANQALSVSLNPAHRHAHRHLHQRDLYIETEVTTYTSWTTVYVYDEETSSAASSTSVFKGAAHSEHFAPLSSSSPATVAAPSTTFATSKSAAVNPVADAPSPQETFKAAAIAPSSAEVTSAAPINIPTIAAPAPKPATTSATADDTKQGQSSNAPAPGGAKRGLAYNDGSLLAPFVGGNSKCTWSYNWGSVADGAAPKGIEYVPMMWGLKVLDGWAANAEKAISQGSKAFLSFNEPDNVGQSNMPPAEAAQQHKAIMNQYADRVRVSSVAITNSNIPGEGIDYLKSWIAACDGGCKFDFCAMHWYSPPNADEFLQHASNVHDVCGKNVWITEFAPISGSDAEIKTFLETVMDAMDNDPKYSFIERYAYFMVKPGSLLSSGTTPSLYGNAYAHS